MAVSGAVGRTLAWSKPPQPRPQACCCARAGRRIQAEDRERRGCRVNRCKLAGAANLRDALRRENERSEGHPGAVPTRRPTVTFRHYQKSTPASVRAAAIALEDELVSNSASQSAQVLNRLKLDDYLEVIEDYGATRRDRTGDLLITKQSPDRK